MNEWLLVKIAISLSTITTTENNSKSEDTEFSNAEHGVVKHPPHDEEPHRVGGEDKIDVAP